MKKTVVGGHQQIGRDGGDERPARARDRRVEESGREALEGAADPRHGPFEGVFRRMADREGLKSYAVRRTSAAASPSSPGWGSSVAAAGSA